VDGLINGDGAVEADSHFADVAIDGIDEVGPRLEVAGILTGDSIDESGCVGADEVAIAAFEHFLKESLHGLSELAEVDGSIADFADLFASERFKVDDEIIGACEVSFGEAVETAVDGVIGALKESIFAVGNELIAEFFGEN
jgi:hypothetical protein